MAQNPHWSTTLPTRARTNPEPNTPAQSTTTTPLDSKSVPELPTRNANDWHGLPPVVRPRGPDAGSYTIIPHRHANPFRNHELHPYPPRTPAPNPITRQQDFDLMVPIGWHTREEPVPTCFAKRSEGGGEEEAVPQSWKIMSKDLKEEAGSEATRADAGESWSGQIKETVTHGLKS